MFDYLYSNDKTLRYEWFRCILENDMLWIWSTLSCMYGWYDKTIVAKVYLWLVTFLETTQEETMTLVEWLLDQCTAKGNEPTHPPGFCKVHRYAKEWNGLLIRGWVAQGLSLKVSLAISKKSPALSCGLHQYCLWVWFIARSCNAINL
jgi:hypothetical protein